MSSTAIGKRPYDASARRERAALTRHRVIDAAARLFVERGYSGTTIPAIAAEAGVAVETVYRASTGKAGLLAAAVQAALAGGADRADTPVEDRTAIRRIIEEADPRTQLAMYAATQPGVWSRAAPLLRVLEAAADGDEALSRLRIEHADQRLTGLRRFAGLLAERGELRAGLSAEAAGDLLWTICAQANYDALVVQRGWSPDAYTEWLARVLISSLLPSDAASTSA